MLNLSELNENQKVAVFWDQGPLLVLGGPDSGKKQVLAARIVKILEDSNRQYFRLLTLTFTNKAATEMRGLLESLVPCEVARVCLATFYSYGVQLLQQHGSHIGIRPNFQILANTKDRLSLLEEVLLQIKKTNGFLPPIERENILKLIDTLLEQGVDTEGAFETLKNYNIDTDTASIVSQIYFEYLKKLSEGNFLDFPSTLAKALLLLEKFPIFIKHIRRVYTHILVDKFQNINVAQFKFLSYLLEPNPTTLFVVSNDAQILYEWHGASFRRFKELKDQFNVSIIQLPENYRCPKEIINLANNLIVNHKNRFEDKQILRSAYCESSESKDIIRLKRFEDVSNEIQWVAKDIQKRSESEKLMCVVIARTNQMINLISKEFKKEGLDTYTSNSQTNFQSQPMLLLYYLLQLSNLNADKHTLARLLKVFFVIEGVFLKPEKIISRALADNNDLLRSFCTEVKINGNISNLTKDLFNKGIKQLLDNLNYQDFINNFFTWLEEKEDQILSYHSSDNIDDNKNHHNILRELQDEKKSFKDILDSISKKFSDDYVSLYHFIHELDLTSKTQKNNKKAIPCFTIQASNGMEFDHVYLVGMVDDILPSWWSIKKGSDFDEMQEERRNCFVAITKPQLSLTLTYSEYVFGFKKNPSRFLKEMQLLTNKNSNIP